MSLGYHSESWTIANGETVSDAVQILDYKVFAIKFATMTGTSATFQGSETKRGTYVALNDQSGSAVSITIASDIIVGLDAAALEVAAIPWLKIVSSDAEGAERKIILMCKK